MKIKPCPFCGNDNENNFDLQTGTKDREGIPVNITCTQCGACGPYEYETGDEERLMLTATFNWNRRFTVK